MHYLAKHSIVISFILIYVATIIYIAWHFQKKSTKNVQDYYLANRTIPGWVVSLAFFSTFISTNTYIGQAGESFKYGMAWIYIGVIWVMFCIISWVLMGPKMYEQSIRLKSLTVPDYFYLRYKSDLANWIKILSSSIILFATLWYMTGIAKGCAHLLSTTLDLDYGWGAFIIIFFTCTYTVMGGMYSVQWTDAIQGILMIVVAGIMFLIPFIYVGGFEIMLHKLANLDHPNPAGKPIGSGMLNFWSDFDVSYILAIGLSIGMKQISDPKLIIRFYSIKDKASMRFAMIWTPIFLAFSLLTVLAVGALVHGMVNQSEASRLIKNTDEVVGFMFTKFNNPWITGICLMGLFAAGMSSLASVILIAGTSIVKDIWHQWQPMNEKQIIARTKISMFAYCFIVFILTLFPPAGIVEMSAFAGSVFAASFFPTIFGGLYFRWGTDIGAATSMLVGISMNLIWRFGIKENILLFKDVHEVFPAFSISVLVYVLVSKLSANRLPEKSYLDMIFAKQK